MRFAIIPPYQNPAVNWGFVLHDLVADMRKKGALEGIEVDVDEGHLVESASEVRDEEFLAYGSLGVIKKVKEYAMMGRYDAIVLTGAIDPGFIPARVVSKIPVVGAIHSGTHAASLIGERFTQIHIVAGRGAGRAEQLYSGQKSDRDRRADLTGSADLTHHDYRRCSGSHLGPQHAGASVAVGAETT